tara:strand:- start:12506 stop:12763 length:258 start_codon:yes stop_codon:yes gene_type:complete
MRQDIAYDFDNILSEGNFKSEVLKENNTFIIKILHDEVSAELALQHIQEFIDNEIEEDGEWLFDNNIESIKEFNIEFKEDYCLVS